MHVYNKDLRREITRRELTDISEVHDYLSLVSMANLRT